jgi:hypothetical protein
VYIKIIHGALVVQAECIIFEHKDLISLALPGRINSLLTQICLIPHSFIWCHEIDLHEHDLGDRVLRLSWRP